MKWIEELGNVTLKVEWDLLLKGKKVSNDALKTFFRLEELNHRLLGLLGFTMIWNQKIDKIVLKNLWIWIPKIMIRIM